MRRPEGTKAFRLRTGGARQGPTFELAGGIRVHLRPLEAISAYEWFFRSRGIVEQTGDGTLQAEGRAVAQLALDVARELVLDWDGVIDDETGEPVPYAYEHFLAAANQDPRVLISFNVAFGDYMNRLFELEKKESAGLPNGASDSDQATAAAVSPSEPLAPKERPEKQASSARS